MLSLEAAQAGMGQGPSGCPRWCRRERWVPCRGVPARGPAGTAGAAVGSGTSQQSTGWRDSPLRRSRHRADHAALPCRLAPRRQSAAQLGPVLAPPGLRDGGGDSGDLPGRLGRCEDESRCRGCFEDENQPCVTPRQPRAALPAPVRCPGSSQCWRVPRGQGGCWGRWHQGHQRLHPGNPTRVLVLPLSPSSSSRGGGAVAANGPACAGSQPGRRRRLANATCVVVAMGWGQGSAARPPQGCRFHF